MDDLNEVRLIGRISAIEEARRLPSGDELRALRLVVRRPERKASVRRGSAFDTIDVTCWTPLTRRMASRLKVGDQVAVEGALRRRFFRGAGGVASRYEVEAHRLSRPKVIAA